ncbi:MAG: UDP-N-acetylmuramate--L-alanine ligase [Candidatus Niyogibacteria bacterium]|nr:UDP-N-acetylmuramate--L-alanine ligase [Candidatus Niyogibacteria bacterium]
MTKKSVHFIGIGGIGMSALAQWYLHEGWRVSGSDEAPSPIIAMLRKKGILVHLGKHEAGNVPKKADHVIYSQAVGITGRNMNPEIREAKKRGVVLRSYPEALGELTKEKYTIAICGTHGKSTTTGFAGVLLKHAGLDPTVIVGATVPEFHNSNFLYGDSHFLVIEADEYKGSFLHYHPDVVIWTSVEWEHIDYFRTFKQTLAHFRRFLARVPEKGYIIANKDDAEIKKIAVSCGVRHTIYYSFSEKKAAEKIRHTMKLCGEHNVSNALAVFMLSHILGIPDYIFWQTLKRFSGVGRRMEYKGKLNGAFVYDDYGHHPTEIQTTLTGVRQKYRKRLQRGKLWCVYQPHQYQRTKYLFRDFTKAFSSAHGVIMLDIYSVAGRETASLKKEVNSQKLARAIIKQKTPALYMPSFKDAARFLKKTVRNNDIVVVMGAGDIWKIWRYLRLS